MKLPYWYYQYRNHFHGPVSCMPHRQKYLNSGCALTVLHCTRFIEWFPYTQYPSDTQSPLIRSTYESIWFTAIFSPPWFTPKSVPSSLLRLPRSQPRNYDIKSVLHRLGFEVSPLALATSSISETSKDSNRERIRKSMKKERDREKQSETAVERKSSDSGGIEWSDKETSPRGEFHDARCLVFFLTCLIIE